MKRLSQGKSLGTKEDRRCITKERKGRQKRQEVLPEGRERRF